MKVTVTMRRRFVRRNLQDHFKALPGKRTEA